MKEAITKKKMLKVIWGFLFIGGLAAIIGIYRAPKSTENPAYFV
jgi:hypothetical protein